MADNFPNKDKTIAYLGNDGKNGLEVIQSDKNVPTTKKWKITRYENNALIFETLYTDKDDFIKTKNKTNFKIIVSEVNDKNLFKFYPNKDKDDFAECNEDELNDEKNTKLFLAMDIAYQYLGADKKKTLEKKTLENLMGNFVRNISEKKGEVNLSVLDEAEKIKNKGFDAILSEIEDGIFEKLYKIAKESEENKAKEELQEKFKQIIAINEKISQIANTDKNNIFTTEEGTVKIMNNNIVYLKKNNKEFFKDDEKWYDATNHSDIKELDDSANEALNRIKIYHPKIGIIDEYVTLEVETILNEDILNAFNSPEELIKYRDNTVIVKHNNEWYQKYKNKIDKVAEKEKENLNLVKLKKLPDKLIVVGIPNNTETLKVKEEKVELQYEKFDLQGKPVNNGVVDNIIEFNESSVIVRIGGESMTFNRNGGGNNSDKNIDELIPKTLSDKISLLKKATEYKGKTLGLFGSEQKIDDLIIPEDFVETCKNYQKLKTDGLDAIQVLYTKGEKDITLPKNGQTFKVMVTGDSGDIERFNKNLEIRDEDKKKIITIKEKNGQYLIAAEENDGAKKAIFSGIFVDRQSHSEREKALEEMLKNDNNNVTIRAASVKNVKDADISELEKIPNAAPKGFTTTPDKKILKTGEFEVIKIMEGEGQNQKESQTLFARKDNKESVTIMTTDKEFMINGKKVTDGSKAGIRIKNDLIESDIQDKSLADRVLANKISLIISDALAKFNSKEYKFKGGSFDGTQENKKFTFEHVKSMIEFAGENGGFGNVIWKNGELDTVKVIIKNEFEIERNKISGNENDIKNLIELSAAIQKELGKAKIISEVNGVTAARLSNIGRLDLKEKLGVMNQA